jgi:Rrf2 family protein
MFKLSRGAEYAIRGLLYMSLQPEGKISFIEEISTAQEVPKAYLAKIFQQLSKKGFVKSYRGPEGGFLLLKAPKDISLFETIEAIEGPIHLNECLIHDGFCPRDQVCPIHDVWREAQTRFIDFLNESNFDQLANSARKKSGNVKKVSNISERGK